MNANRFMTALSPHSLKTGVLQKVREPSFLKYDSFAGNKGMNLNPEEVSEEKSSERSKKEEGIDQNALPQINEIVNGRKGSSYEYEF